MKKIKAFTFIELLIVSAILIIISSTSVFYFFGFLDQTKLNTGIDYIKDELKILDNKVKNKDVLDYKLFLKKEALFFIVNENNLSLQNHLWFSGSLDYERGEGKIFLDPIGQNTEALKIDIYANGKLIEDFLNPGDLKMDYGFSKFKNYRITGTYNQQILNDIEIKYFAESNLNHTKQDYLKLVKIDTDKNINLDNVKIINVLGKKRFSDDVNSSVLKLTFDVNGKQKILEIKK